MKNILITYAWDIFRISDKFKVDLGVARDMFVGNLEGKEVLYPVDGVNFDGLKSEWSSLDEDTRGIYKTEFNDIPQSVKTQLSKFFTAHNKTAFDALITNAGETHVGE